MGNPVTLAHPRLTQTVTRAEMISTSFLDNVASIHQQTVREIAMKRKFFDLQRLIDEFFTDDWMYPWGSLPPQ